MMETGRLLDNFVEIDFTLVLWVFGALTALIFLVIVVRLLRNIFGGRIRRIQEFGMDFDAVADMLDKGLLSADEAKRVKSVLTRHFSRLYEQRLARPRAGDFAAVVEAEIIASGDSTAAPAGSPKPSRVGAPHAAPARPQSATKPSPGAPPSPAPPASAESGADEETVELPLDVLDMYRAGMITPDEMAALRRFYAERARRAK